MSTADYKTMTTAEIREDFLKFFESKGCKLCPSSSLVPDDPSLLLANAGMNQFKEYYQGSKTMKEIGACSCQKCLRTNDIDNIGDARHLSFFEMLGNFSFGGYTKADAIAWAYEFITGDEHLGLPKDRLYMTVFEDDNEAIELWHEQGVSYDHISRLGEEDNFWAAGPTGPCGPCSEIYFDQGEEYGCGSPDCAPGCDCDRYLEFWNLVFTQYDRQEDGSMPELPHRNIDTGMGLERIAAIMQHKGTNYDGDLLQSLIGVGERLSGHAYGTDAAKDRSLRILADHSRSVTFMIGDGILPGNEGRGYILRRLLRRAVYHARLMGIESPFISTYVDEVTRLMGADYPALVEQNALIQGIVRAEEERFGATLDAGESMLEAECAKLAEGEALPGEVAFKLHDTYGFPIDLTREICEAAGHDVDMDGFDACMTEQKERARAAANRDAWSNFNDVWTGLSDKLGATEFCGYDDDSADGCRVVAIVAGDAEAECANPGDEVSVVLDRTPFYAEMGGQVADHGVITADGVEFVVTDVQKNKGGKYMHYGKLLRGALHVGDSVSPAIDTERRSAVRRAHTATHLLDAALKKVLGDHVHQAGSLVEPDRLRFDFTHFEAITPEQLLQVEDLVNDAVLDGLSVITEELPLAEAKARGAVATFGEKYGETVRVVTMGEFSMELCGGTHLDNTAKAGMFRIKSESSVASGVRRIEATTGKVSLEETRHGRTTLLKAAQFFKTAPSSILERMEQQANEMKELRQAVEKFKAEASLGEAKQVMASAKAVGGLHIITSTRQGLDANALRTMGDFLRDKDPVVVAVLASIVGEKVSFLAVCGKEAVAKGIKAGELVKSVSAVCGGKGGGKPDSAMGGGTDLLKVDDALATVDDFVSSKLG